MRPERREGGFGLVAALFVIIIVAAVIAAMARLATTQNATNSMAIQQARAYQTARAGVEWGISRSLNPVNPCEASESFSLDNFLVTVECVAPSAVVVNEENKSVQFYRITSTAEFGQAGDADYAYRQLSVVVEEP